MRGDAKTILVVEDEFLVRLDVALQLEDEGFEVVSAGTADEALEVLPIEPVDVVFTDINMPGQIDGLQLAHEVLTNWPKVNVIITSGRKYDGSVLPQNALFVAKPYDINQVVQTIRELRRSH